MAEVTARLGDDRRVDDRHHLFDVVEQEAIEENFVVVLKSSKVDVAVERLFVGKVGGVGSRYLFFERFDVGRKQAVEAEAEALFDGERGSFIESGRAQQARAVQSCGKRSH